MAEFDGAPRRGDWHGRWISKALHSEILWPTGAPERLLDRSTLWNEVKAGEKRKDAQLAREVEISLPRELTQAQAIKLAQDFVREKLRSHGMVADLNVHWTQAGDGEAQPPAHVMLTMREAGPDGFGKKVRRRSGRLPSGWARWRSPRCGGSARPGSSRRQHGSWRPGARGKRWHAMRRPGW